MADVSQEARCGGCGRLNWFPPREKPEDELLCPTCKKPCTLTGRIQLPEMQGTKGKYGSDTQQGVDPRQAYRVWMP
ncbi:MAG TPA: hypothetical protein VJ761_05305 [Ktedonobacteraceae bacterium]|nr:hypothetical protein [Ktedonobacteraceae bacterium]